MTTPDIALARRFWMHVHEGGTLTSVDVGRMVTALEETFQMYVDANEARIDAEAKLALVISAYRIEAMRRDDYRHTAFNQHIVELIGQGDE